MAEFTGVIRNTYQSFHANSGNTREQHSRVLWAPFDCYECFTFWSKASDTLHFNVIRVHHFVGCMWGQNAFANQICPIKAGFKMVPHKDSHTSTRTSKWHTYARITMPRARGCCQSAGCGLWFQHRSLGRATCCWVRKQREGGSTEERNEMKW